jgi:hypothetical protein
MLHRRIVIAAWSIGVLFSTLVSLALGELAIRATHLLRDGIPFSEVPSGRVGPIMLDPHLGWRATAHYKQDLLDTTQRGVVYRVHRSQGPQGFRSYGDVRARRPKVLVIGDSFTHASAVSDDKTYHALLRKKLGLEVFAYGAGGYGTLQEYLILDEVFNDIRPTMLLWQFCSNDFINNDHALEVASTRHNNGWTRPYWEDGHIVFRSPKPASMQIREWIHHHSRFLYFLVSRVDRLRAQAASESVERVIARKGMAHPEFARSVHITDELMGQVRARVGAIPIYAFSCDADQPYTAAFETIASHHGIQYLKDVPDSVQEALDKGLDVLASDGHWNELGHALIAEKLAKHLQRTRLDPNMTVSANIPSR